MKAAMVEPRPGSTPITTPMMEERIAVGSTWRISRGVKRQSSFSAPQDASAPLFWPRNCFCIWNTSSERARVPMATLIRGMPALRVRLLKVRRSSPKQSMPTQDSSMPAAAAISALPREPESSPETRTREKTMIAHKSGGESFSATAASGMERIIREIAEMVSPKKEENSEHFRAFSPLPWRAMG